jgi:RNA polymerase sigma factor (sigma-70 family)
VRAERDDQRLIAAYRRGDDTAFDAIFDRYRPMLLRYARRVLGGGAEHAEDVVQEGMWRAARALRRDERHIELRPWLFRLVRNCALDELARVRTDSVDLDLVEPAGVLRAPEVTQPEHAHERRSYLREVLGDLSALPEQQRHALVRRELDGISHTQLAVELGVSEQASKNLVFRARTNLVKHRDARTSSCAEVQRDLLTAHDAQRRASAATYRHVATCRDCRAFRGALRTQRRAFALLSPGPLLLVGGLAFFGVKAAAATAKGTAVKVAGATATVATVGAVGAVQVFDVGDPAPQAVESRAVPGGAVRTGEPLPGGTAVVRLRVAVPAGGTAAQTVELPCPAGLRTADLLPAAGAPATVTYAPSSLIGTDRVARVVVEPRERSGRRQTVRVAVLCKRPDREGSIVAPEPGRAGPRALAASAGDELRVTARRADLHESPAGAVVGSVRLGQPVDARGEARDGWVPVVTDTGERGWLRTDAVGRR